MWNFTGRQNDKQGEYNVLNGNWLSGIPFIDEIRLGNQAELHEDALNNKCKKHLLLFTLYFRTYRTIFSISTRSKNGFGY